MSYCRFSEADVYVFTSRSGLECCGCWLQERKWVDDPEERFFGGWSEPVGEVIQTTFKSNAGMIEHLEKHVAAGHHVPTHVFERLRDPEDAAENEAVWAEYQGKGT